MPTAASKRLLSPEVDIATLVRSVEGEANDVQQRFWIMLMCPVKSPDFPMTRAFRQLWARKHIPVFATGKPTIGSRIVDERSKD